MIVYLTVTAKARSGKGKPIVYDRVYDIVHLYRYDVIKENTHACLRLLMGKPSGETKRKYIDLMKYDVEIKKAGNDQDDG